MKATEKPERAEELVGHARDVVDGKAVIPAMKYHVRGPEFHLSDLDLCLAKTFYAKTLDDPPKKNNDAILKFIRGRAVERIMASEAEPREKDGIVCSVDYISPDWGLAEIKSVATDSSRFAPTETKNGIYPHWLQRIKGYVHCYDTDTLTLFVYFLTGNTASHRWGADGRKSVDFRAWELKFNAAEIAENWAEVIKRRDVLRSAIDNQELPPKEYAAQNSWECEGCEMSEFCPHFSFGYAGL